MTWLILALSLATASPDATAPSPATGPAGAWDPAELVPVPVPEPSGRAVDYYRSGLRLWFLVHAWGLFVPAVILFTGLSGRMRDLARRVGRTWYGTIAAYALLYLGLTYLIDLPIDYYLGYVRPHAYDLSRQGLGRWLATGLKSLGITAVAAVALLWVPFLLLARSPRRWWLWAGLLMLPFVLFATWVKPIWIDPLFHTFGPMHDKALEAKILRLAERAGVEGGRVFEVDMGRDTRTVNAYVTGLVGTKRIVLWDTLLARLDEKEVLAVVGHELGHYTLNHVAWGVTMSGLGSLVLLALIDGGGGGRVARHGRRFGFDRLSDVAAVPLFVFLIQGLNLIGAPIPLAVSRTIEHEADRFALEITRGNRSAASAFVKLQGVNLSNPRPGLLSVLWRSSHPPIGDRIDFCNDYHPWTTGIPGRFDRLFVPTPRPSGLAGPAGAIHESR